MIDIDSVDVTMDASYQRPAIMREAGVARWPAAPIRGAEDEDAIAPISATLLSQGLIFHSGPREELLSELDEKIRQARVVQQAYRNRIETLRSEAEFDGFRINEGSEKDFWIFINLHPFVQKGLLAAVDNGNLRAVWKGEHGTHIGLQFQGNRNVQYVIFKRRTPGGEISRVAGYDTIDGIKRQIHAFKLEPLLYA